MSYYLRVFFQESIQDISMEDRTVIGTEDSLIPGCSSVFHFFENDNGYMVSGQDGTVNLSDGQFLQLGNGIKALLVRSEDTAIAELDLGGIAEFSIGRDTESDLILPSRPDVRSDLVNVARNHARAVRSTNGWIISSAKVEAKIFVNNHLSSRETRVLEGDILEIGKYSIRFDENRVLAFAKPLTQVSGDLDSFAQDTKERSASKGHRGRAETAAVEPPTFNRGPHVRTAIPESEIKLPTKEHFGDKPEFNWASTLLPPIAMLLVMLGIYFFTGNAMSLMYTVPMYGVTMIVAIINFRSQRVKFKKKRKAGEQAYTQQVEALADEISRIKQQQMGVLEKEYPSLDDCFTIVQSHDARLWRIHLEEEMFLDLRVGTGSVPTHIKIQGERSSENEEIIADALYLKKAPVSLPIAKYFNVGLVGDQQNTMEELKRLVIQAVVNHSYDELKLVFFISEAALDEWQWVRWLPHIWDDERKRRFIATDYASTKRVSRYFEEILSRRAGLKNRQNNSPHYLFIFTDGTMLRFTDLLKYMIAGDGDLHCSSIITGQSRSQLPAGCQAIVEISNDSYGQWYATDDDSIRHKFKCDWISGQAYESLARLMAPIHVTDSSGAKGFPPAVTFLEGYGVSSVGELNIERRWERARPEKTLAVPVGIKENGDTFYFDIHEKAHGPHGMASGRAGSGKSEMVQSWILSLALNFRPNQVSFVIVDFKGTGLLNPFKRLPHVAGTISNLDHNSERNVVALQREMDRRMEIFKKYSVSDITTFYQKLGKGEASDSFPFLIVVVDEYADLKKEHPEFSPAIDRVYTLGRSLGIYIITLAQDAASAASEMIQANSRFRWCMQVATSDASRGMLETTDAFTMPNAPGRGFVKAGDFEVYEQIQSFWSGAAYVENGDHDAQQPIKISQVAFDGTRIPFEESHGNERNISTEKEINKVVDYIDRYVTLHKIPRAIQIWQPPMPETITLDDVLTDTFDGTSWPQIKELELTVGLVDDPNRQRQYPLRFAMSKSGHISVQGSPESGKTTFLLSAVMSLSERYNPDDVQIYLFDYDKWALNLVRNLPHVKGSSAAAEPEEIREYITQIHEELSRRKRCFLEAGAISHEGYCLNVEKIPAIFILVDNITAAWDDGQEMSSLLEEVAAKGSGYGIYLVATAPGSLPYRIQNAFRTKLSLYQNDRSEYVSIVGRSDISPESYAGRGLVKLDYAVEFQTALPVSGETENERNQTIHEIVDAMRSVWTPKQAEEKTSLTESIDFQPGCVVLGIDRATQSALFYDDEGKHCLTVSCVSPETRKLFLLSLVNQAVSSDAEVILFDDKDTTGKCYSQFVKHYFSLGDPAGDRCLADLMPALQQRYDSKESGESSDFTPLYLIIAEFGEFFEAAQDDSIAYLKDIVTLGKGLNVHLFVISDCAAIRSLGQAGEKLTHALLRENHVLLFGGSFETHQIFSSDLTMQEQAREFPENEGWYLLDGKAKQISQVIVEENNL